MKSFDMHTVFGKLFCWCFVHKIIKTASDLFRTEATEGRTGFVSVTLQCWFLQLIFFVKSLIECS